MSDLWSVTVPSWGTAVGTVLVAVVAVGVAWSGYRRADRERAEARHRAQAELIAAWADHRSPKMLPADDRYQVEEQVMAAIVRNDSSLPVWNVVVDFVHPETGQKPPTVPSRTVEVIPPRDERAIPRPQALSTWSRLRVVITFLDANNVTWRRDHRGELTEVRR